MSWGVALRNGIALGLGNVISFINGGAQDDEPGYLLTEAGEYITQEDGGLIELE